jgi:hypothetical protein
MICLEIIGHEIPTTLTVCGHEYHKECLIKTGGECQLCDKEYIDVDETMKPTYRELMDLLTSTQLILNKLTECESDNTLFIFFGQSCAYSYLMLEEINPELSRRNTVLVPGSGQHIPNTCTVETFAERILLKLLPDNLKVFLIFIL